MTYQGAARRLQVSESTIRGRLVKARSLLRSRLSRHEGVAAIPPTNEIVRRGRPPRVPPALTAATVRSAMSFARGGAGMSAISAAVVELMEGVLMMTSVTRWIIGASSLAAVCLAASGSAALTAKGDDVPTAAKAVATERGPRSVEVRQGDPPDPSPARVLTLDDAIGCLLTRSLDLRSKFAEIPMARADVLTAGLRTRPLLPASPQLAPFGDHSSLLPSGYTQYGINISHPLDYSHKREVRARSAGTAINVVEAQYQDAVRNRIDGLYTVYVDVQEAQERLRQEEYNLAHWDELLKRTRERVKLGSVPAGDVGPIEASRRVADLRRSEAKATLRQTKVALGSLLDLPVEESNRLEVERLGVTGSPIPASESVIRVALDARPDLTALRIGVTRAQADLKRATRNEDAYLLYQPYTFQDKPETVRETKASYATGVTVPLPLYNRQQGNRQRAKVNLEQAQMQLAAQEGAINQEVVERHREFESSRAEFRRTLINLQRHRRAFLEAERRCQTGEGKIDDIVQARHDFEASEKPYLDLLVRHRRKVLALNTAVGVRLFP